MDYRFENFAERIGAFLPDLIGALLVLLIGWLIAKGIKTLIVKLLRKTSWDEKVFGRNSNIGDTNVFLANIAYYLIMIIVILMVLEILGINEALTPLGNMMNEFLAFIPNLIGAILIGFIGYLLAKFVSNLITIGGNMLDNFVDKTGFKDTDKLVRILRKVVFIVIFIPFLIQAFNALQMEAISQPANDILYAFTEMIGQILVAALILIVFIWGGKFLANFLEDLFRSLGLESAGERIQIKNMIGADQSLSKIFANLIYFFLVFFGIITAVEILGLSRLTEILNEILEVTGQIIFGLIILAIGNYISLLIYNTMTKSSNNTFIAGVIRWASLALFIAIALRTMGIANEIVELAFGLILGAIAVAVALSYGLGGRDAAGEHFKDIVRKMRSEASDIPAEKTPDNLTGPIRTPGDTRNSPGRNPLDPTGGPGITNYPSKRPENPTDPIDPRRDPHSTFDPDRGTNTSSDPKRGSETTDPRGPQRPLDSNRDNDYPNNPNRGTQGPTDAGRGSGTTGQPTRGPQNPNNLNRDTDNPNNPNRGTQGPTDSGRGSGTTGQPARGPQNPNNLNRDTDNQNNPNRGTQGPTDSGRGFGTTGQPPRGPQNPDNPSRDTDYPNNPNRGTQGPTDPGRGSGTTGQPPRGPQNPNNPNRDTDYPNNPYRGTQGPTDPGRGSGTGNSSDSRGTDDPNRPDRRGLDPDDPRFNP